MLEFCFLTENILLQDDERIKASIHAAHRRWWRAADEGHKSGFVILALSERLAAARPDENLLRFAQRLARLYLLEDDILPDRIYLDQVYLEIPGHRHRYRFRWDAGVNVFAAAGDGRWWQDHRIPGGLAFSVNSVGHMAKSGQVRGALLNMGVEDDELELGAVADLHDAHRFAMLTIAKASHAISGPATWLLQPDDVDLAECPPPRQTMGTKLEQYSPCAYAGIYHTDHTLPSTYFRNDVEAPPSAAAMALDFTYLYVNTVDNPAYHTMGIGEQIRGDQPTTTGSERPRDKAHRLWPVEVAPEQMPNFDD
jgi:hypothetical protein